VLKAWGRRGEVITESHTDVESRFSANMQLWALAKDGSRRPVLIESLWPHKGCLVLKFAGIDSISDAEKLRGQELQVPSEQRGQVEAGWAFVSDLIGCAVWDGERELGKVSDVRFGAGEAPLLVVKAGRLEYEIPYAEAYMQKLDLSEKQIRMRLPEGLLEVNAPLTAEEKRQQRKV